MSLLISSLIFMVRPSMYLYVLSLHRPKRILNPIPSFLSFGISDKSVQWHLKSENASLSFQKECVSGLEFLYVVIVLGPFVCNVCTYNRYLQVYKRRFEQVEKNFCPNSTCIMPGINYSHIFTVLDFAHDRSSSAAQPNQVLRFQSGWD